MSEIEGIVKGDVIIPLKPLRKLEDRKVRKKIAEVGVVDAGKLHFYLGF